MKRFTSTLLIALSMVVTLMCTSLQTAAAQSPAEVPVVLFQPDAWNIDNTDVSDRRIIAYVDPKNDNRIEVLARDLVRESNAPALFEAFNDQLLKSNFGVIEPPNERTFDTNDAKQRTGKWAEYSFTSSEIPIDIITFSYTAKNTAILLVGYFANINRSAGIETMKTMIANMIDKPE